MSNDNELAVPAGDKLVTLGDRSVSYGPRQEFDGSVEPCAPMAAQFWGVYRWAGKDRWWWIADVADEDTARVVAAAYLLNVKPDWAH
ncbi:MULTISPECIES: hypothetical protein [Stenotrophomonas]|uniref:Uncharacterized protein n=1 Tax=Stenotrophomonas pavanii TaxID=487698 RepID=A0A246KYK8_9GAMM|nr:MULTISPECIES: hypothetical protein [Stenotrophomonas]OWR33648.1 hypothetical protein CEE55_10915 [Stenotrophomonas pavanii]